MPKQVHVSDVLRGREIEIVRCIAEGYKNKNIAKIVGVTHFTIKNYLAVIYDKTGMGSRTELALWYISHGGKFKQGRGE